MGTFILAAVLITSGAPPQRYEVVNRTSPRFVVVNKTAYICGASCVCAPGKCPSQCPVASRPDLVTTDGRTIRWTGSAYMFVGSAPAVSGCANGQCPLPRR